MTPRLCSTILREEYRGVLKDLTQVLTGGMFQKVHAILLFPRQSCLQRRVSTFRDRLPPNTRQPLGMLDRHLRAIRQPMRPDAIITTRHFLQVQT